MWQPDMNSLDQLSQILSQATMADNKTQNEIYKTIDELSKKPEFYNYLAFIVGINNNPKITSLRQIAALTLKSSLHRNFENVPDENLNYVKQALLQNFNDPSPVVRRSVSLVVIEIVFNSGFLAWPDVLKFLTNNLDANDVGIIENTIDCISKIVEEFRMNSDSYDFLVSEKMGQPLNQLLPKLLVLCEPKIPAEIRAAAILTLNHFIYAMPPAFLIMIKDYFALLYEGCKDQNPLVRQRSVQGFVALLETRKDLVLPHLDKILDRIVDCCGDSDYEVARNAGLFWEEYLIREPDEPMDRIYHLRSYFDRLLPCLLGGLKFTELDRANQDDEGESIGKQTESLILIGKEESKDDDDLDDKEEENSSFFDRGMHTFRKMCGQIFERLSYLFRDEIFEKLQDRIFLCLQSEDWKIKEIGIVCIGSLAGGCRQAIEKHLKDLIPFFIQNLESNNNIIRSNSLWAMSRFTSWFLKQATTQPQVLQDYIKLILKLVLDSDKSVQASACAALAFLITNDANALTNYMNDIFKYLKPVFEIYSGRSLKVLYDTVGLVAEKLPNKIKEQEIQEVLMPTILAKWKTTNSEDITLPSLIECVNYLLVALGKDSKQYIEVFAARAIQLIAEYLAYVKNNGKKLEYQKRDLCCRALDLLSNILGIIDVEFELIVKNSNLLDLIGECLQSDIFEVKQFACSLIGELSKLCTNALVGKAQILLQVLAKHLQIVPTEQDPGNNFLILTNNATFAISEMIVAYSNEITQYFPELAAKFADLLLTKALNKTLAFNIATVLGRIAVYQPKAVAPYLPTITKHWSVAMTYASTETSKLQAFKGFFLAINENPEGIVQDFPFFCKALANYKHNDAELETASKTLLHNFKRLSGNNWESYFVKFPMELQIQLNERYGL